MNKQEITRFFDEQASHWDDDMIRSDEIIGIILDNADVTAGRRVLDVACGTGVLIPDYMARGAESITAIDISPEMIRRAGEKFSGESRVHLLCGDVETAEPGQDFDVIVVYNAFPHFPEPERLITRLASLLRKGGTLTVAHGMSKAAIDAHHSGSAHHVSVGLMEAEELAALFEKAGLRVTVCLSDERMYQVAGSKQH